jgi:hypothetical protein
MDKETKIEIAKRIKAKSFAKGKHLKLYAFNIDMETPLLYSESGNFACRVN